jgi:peptide/nickel transport system permease protein
MAEPNGVDPRPVPSRAMLRRGSGRLFVAGFWLIVIVACALFAPYIAPHDPLAQDLMLEKLPPYWLAGADKAYPLGADTLGRDMLSRLIFAAQPALTVAVIAASAACLTGSVLGLLAGYLGGWWDRVISRLVDIWMAFPPVLLSVLLVAVLGPSLYSVIIAIAIIDWTRFCRVVRAETMRQRAMDYVESARAIGMSRFAIIRREILPNVLPAIIVLFFVEMGIAVIVEAILSYVNLSVSSDWPTWGGMISEGRLMIYQAWWVMVFPLIALFLTVLAFSQFGEGLRERFDPVLR